MKGSVMHAADLFKAMDEAGVAVLTLTEGLLEAELLASRLTRAEARRQLMLLAHAAEGLSPELRQQLPEVDWAGLQAAARALSGPPGTALDEALVHAVQSLVPVTLLWLRLYRQNQPVLFSRDAGLGS